MFIDPVHSKPMQKKILILALVVIFSCGACSIAVEKSITFESLLEQNEISIRQVKSLSGEVKQGHGPLLLMPVANHMEVQFWFKPGILFYLGAGNIALVTKTMESDQDTGTILWPREKVGNDFGKELEALYK